MRYRKRPIVIDAMQLSEGNFDEVCNWIGEENLADGTSKDECCIEIVTLEGNHLARKNDYIIWGVADEYSPCKPDIFAATYDAVTGKE